MTHTIPSNQSNFDFLPDSAFIRQKSLIAERIIPFSAATMWRKVKSGEFPAPVKISSNITAFNVGLIRQWLRNPQNYSAQKHSCKAEAI